MRRRGHRLVEQLISGGAPAAVGDFGSHGIQGGINGSQIGGGPPLRCERSQLYLQGAAGLHDLRHPVPVLAQLPQH